MGEEGRRHKEEEETGSRRVTSPTVTSCPAFSGSLLEIRKNCVDGCDKKKMLMIIRCTKKKIFSCQRFHRIHLVNVLLQYSASRDSSLPEWRGKVPSFFSCLLHFSQSVSCNAHFVMSQRASDTCPVGFIPQAKRRSNQASGFGFKSCRFFVGDCKQRAKLNLHLRSTDWRRRGEVSQPASE